MRIENELVLSRSALEPRCVGITSPRRRRTPTTASFATRRLTFCISIHVRASVSGAPRITRDPGRDGPGDSVAVLSRFAAEERGAGATAANSTTMAIATAPRTYRAPSARASRFECGTKSMSVRPPACPRGRALAGDSTVQRPSIPVPSGASGVFSAVNAVFRPASVEANVRASRPAAALRRVAMTPRDMCASVPKPNGDTDATERWPNRGLTSESCGLTSSCGRRPINAAVDRPTSGDSAPMKTRNTPLPLSAIVVLALAACADNATTAPAARQPAVSLATNALDFMPLASSVACTTGGTPAAVFSIPAGFAQTNIASEPDYLGNPDMITQ